MERKQFFIEVHAKLSHLASAQSEQRKHAKQSQYLRGDSGIQSQLDLRAMKISALHYILDQNKIRPNKSHFYDPTNRTLVHLIRKYQQKFSIDMVT